MLIDYRGVIKLVTESRLETPATYQKPFLDYLRVIVRGGHGGPPLKNTNRGRNFRGPGYGGHGGDVIFQSSHLISDLLKLKQEIYAQNGGAGAGTSRGLHAKDKIIKVPLGLIVRKRLETGERDQEGRKIKVSVFWKQFLNDDESLIVAKGGRGGVGPSTFKKHDNKLPECGEKCFLELELRLINDVAFIGDASVGKTSIISALTGYQTRIGPENGSTTRPHVSLLKFKDGVEIKLLDLPPLDPHNNVEYLKLINRHIYRSKAVAYVLDSSRVFDNSFEKLRNIIFNESASHISKSEIVIVTKCDMLHKDSLFNLDTIFYKIKSKFPHIQIVPTSASFGLGLSEAADAIRNSIIQPSNIVLTTQTTQLDNIENQIVLQ